MYSTILFIVLLSVQSFFGSGSMAISADEAARYVEANNEDALARGILELSRDDAARARMRSFGMERVRKALAWDYSVPPLLAAYEKAGAIARARGRPLPAGPRRLNPLRKD